MKSLKFFLIATIFVAVVQNSAFAMNTEPLEIVNETGKVIMSLYAVPVQKKTWGNDLVGNGVMNQGDFRSIHYDSSYALYKIKVEFADGTTFTNKEVNLLNIWRLSIMRDGTFSENVRG